MNDFLLVVTTVFGNAWKLYQIPVPIPGVNFTFGDIVLAMAFGSLALGFVYMFTSPSGAASVGRNTQNPRISEERKNDTR